MKLGRTKMITPDGERARIVAVEPQQDRVIDLARAYAAVLKRHGATDDAAVRLARTLFPSIMSRALANSELLPGDLVATGTLGFGSGLEIDARLRPGDTLELELDGVGAVRTTIGDPDVAPWRPEEKPCPWSTQNSEEAMA